MVGVTQPITNVICGAAGSGVRSGRSARQRIPAAIHCIGGASRIDIEEMRDLIPLELHIEEAIAAESETIVLVVPSDLVDRVAAAKSVISRHAPLLDQAVLCDFIREGHFGRHLRRMRDVYAARLHTLLKEARARPEGLAEGAPIEARPPTVGRPAHGIPSPDAAARVAPSDDQARSIT